ncbi:VanZ family protein [Stackebrandtia nassauensis]|uniref:VanZ family protein n=1 Tax=Stackebrandtia nassauensis (strain DSM 44728 / CIP 108903 / NRRL B-16338 / NBRC 102104 / LLR-40K-21) TaxID=446470 RepID=D3Q4X8_STANL|nr:VanZ family protein [Stackebrandtia nassauensis]ADD42158.1 VanZ family protein [Stackebrandtia nassauensis DSM 44728]
MTEVWDRWGTVLTATAVAVPVVVALVWALARRRIRDGADARTAWRRSAAEVCAVAGTLPWLWMVLTPRPAASTVNLVPLSDLAALFTAAPTTIVVQLGGNLLVFAALGFCLPIRFAIPVAAVALVGAAGATAIEVLQYLFDIGRVSSVDDVLVNTLGAVLAALLSRPWWVARTWAARTQPRRIPVG